MLSFVRSLLFLTRSSLDDLIGSGVPEATRQQVQAGAGDRRRLVQAGTARSAEGAASASPNVILFSAATGDRHSPAGLESADGRAGIATNWTCSSVSLAVSCVGAAERTLTVSLIRDFFPRLSVQGDEELAREALKRRQTFQVRYPLSFLLAVLLAHPERSVLGAGGDSNSLDCATAAGPRVMENLTPWPLSPLVVVRRRTRTA